MRHEQSRKMAWKNAQGLESRQIYVKSSFYHGKPEKTDKITLPHPFFSKKYSRPRMGERLYLLI